MFTQSPASLALTITHSLHQLQPVDYKQSKNQIYSSLKIINERDLLSKYIFLLGQSPKLNVYNQLKNVYNHISHYPTTWSHYNIFRSLDKLCLVNIIQFLSITDFIQLGQCDTYLFIETEKKTLIKNANNITQVSDNLLYTRTKPLPFKCWFPTNLLIYNEISELECHQIKYKTSDCIVNQYMLQNIFYSLKHLHIQQISFFSHLSIEFIFNVKLPILESLKFELHGLGDLNYPFDSAIIDRFNKNFRNKYSTAESMRRIDHLHFGNWKVSPDPDVNFTDTLLTFAGNYKQLSIDNQYKLIVKNEQDWNKIFHNQLENLSLFADQLMCAMAPISSCVCSSLKTLSIYGHGANHSDCKYYQSIGSNLQISGAFQHLSSLILIMLPDINGYLGQHLEFYTSKIIQSFNYFINNNIPIKCLTFKYPMDYDYGTRLYWTSFTLFSFKSLSNQLAINRSNSLTHIKFIWTVDSVLWLGHKPTELCNNITNDKYNFIKNCIAKEINLNMCDKDWVNDELLISLLVAIDQWFSNLSKRQYGQQFQTSLCICLNADE